MLKISLDKGRMFALGAVSVAVVLVAMMANPAYAANAEVDFGYGSDAIPSDIYRVTVEAKGHAYLRIDEENIKRYDCETSLVIEIAPATEASERKVNITGSVKVNNEIFTIKSGNAALRRGRNLAYIVCQGVDQSGNQMSLKLAARYFWWGGRTYALRSTALLKTAENQILLVQRGIARIE